MSCDIDESHYHYLLSSAEVTEDQKFMKIRFQDLSIFKEGATQFNKLLLLLEITKKVKNEFVINLGKT